MTNERVGMTDICKFVADLYICGKNHNLFRPFFPIVQLSADFFHFSDQIFKNIDSEKFEIETGTDINFELLEDKLALGQNFKFIRTGISLYHQVEKVHS